MFKCNDCFVFILYIHVIYEHILGRLFRMEDNIISMCVTSVRVDLRLKHTPVSSAVQ